MTMYRLKSYNNTLAASYIGYVVQAIVNCFVPLLFIRFTQEFSIDFTKITLIVTLNFIIQLSVDAIASKLVDKIGYRISMIIAHVLCAAGLAAKFNRRQLCGYLDLRCNVCHRRRLDRGLYLSDSRILSY